MRSMWKGFLRFGLVTVPIRLFLAADPPSSWGHLLCPTDQSRLQSRLWCAIEAIEVQRTAALRGIEVGRDQYVVVSDDDRDTLPSATKHVVAIEQFVRSEEAREVTRFARSTYYSEPDGVGRVAYALLRDVLADRGLLAIGRVALRDRERLAVIEAVGDCLTLTTLVWPDEIRQVSALDLPGSVEVPERERVVAGLLADAMVARFDASAFRDTHRDAVDALVAMKVAGNEVVSGPEPSPGPVLVDLMAALEASVEEARRRAAERAPASIASAPEKSRSRRRVDDVNAA